MSDEEDPRKSKKAERNGRFQLSDLNKIFTVIIEVFFIFKNY